MSKSSEKNPDLHDERGKFKKGHPKVGGSKVGCRRARIVLTEQLYPFYENMGGLIESIPDPFSRVKAVALMSKYTMPALSSVDYRESVQRNLTAEEQLLAMNARFHGKPLPQTEDDEEDI
jgi:hypothetical protein